MPQVQVHVSMPLPAEEVFPFLADGRNLAAWHSGVMSIRPDGDAPAGHAYRYRFPGRRREHRLVRTVYEPPVRVGFTGQRMWTPLGTQVPRFDFRLRPLGDACRVEVGVTSYLSGALLLLWPVVACGWRRDLPADAQALYETLTGAGRPAGTPPGPVRQPADAPAPRLCAADRPYGAPPSPRGRDAVRAGLQQG
ncbi:hypothetical protein GCM10010420_00360 [Streptomyces glaucosporus]|uniref:SRPBCC family protein n=1 Tax=Streptomyces glaucosporus TaxID=284044 RepID=A0ABP5ULE7_9ACTN